MDTSLDDERDQPVRIVAGFEVRRLMEAGGAADAACCPICESDDATRRQRVAGFTIGGSLL